MKKTLFLLGGVIIGITLTLVALWVIKTDPEIGGKRDWSILQGIELRNRKVHFDSIQITQEYEYSVLSLTYNGKNYHILLDPRARPWYKQLPQGDFHITSKQLDEILQKHVTSPRVIVELKKRIKE